MGIKRLSFKHNHNRSSKGRPTKDLEGAWMELKCIQDLTSEQDHKTDQRVL